MKPVLSGTLLSPKITCLGWLPPPVSSQAHCTSRALASLSSAPRAFPPLTFPSGCAQHLHPRARHIALWGREEATVFSNNCYKKFPRAAPFTKHVYTTKRLHSMISKCVFKCIATISWQQTAAFLILLIHPHQAINNGLGLTPVLNTRYT